MEEKQFSIEDFVKYSDSKKFIIYTDGSCIPNPGPGGWAYEIRDQDENKIIELSGADKSTTNNRMELTAVIKAFEDEVIPINSNVVIKSKPILVSLFFSYIYVIYKIAHIYFFIYNFYECVG